MVTLQCSPGLVPSQQMMSVCANGRWTPDPARLVCRGNQYLYRIHLIPSHCCTVLISGSSADCGDPSQPVNGDAMAHESTLEDSNIFFQCNPGFFPSMQMMSVCAHNGSWTPDPANLTCMIPPPGRYANVLVYSVCPARQSHSCIDTLLLWHCIQVTVECLQAPPMAL